MSTTWFIVALACLATLIVVVVLAIVYVAWSRWRLRRQPFTQIPQEPDDTTAIELSPRDGKPDDTKPTMEPVISQPPELVIIKAPDDMQNVSLDPAAAAPAEPQGTPDLRARDKE